VLHEFDIIDAKCKALIARAEQSVVGGDILVETAIVIECTRLAIRIKQLRACHEILMIVASDIDDAIAKIERRIARATTNGNTTA
jgi:hypothetical protein